jgi:hypothetical protein
MLLLLILTAAAATTFPFESGTTFRPFVGSPAERADVTVFLNGTCTTGGETSAYIGEGAYPIVSGGNRLCLGPSAPLWKWFAQVRIGKDRISLLREAEEVEGRRFTCLDEGAYPCAADVDGMRIRFFSGNTTLVVPSFNTDLWDTGAESVTLGEHIIVPRGSNVVHLTRTTLTMEAVSDYTMELTLAIIIQVLLYAFALTSDSDLNPVLYAAATAAVIYFDTHLARKLFVIPYWFGARHKTPLLLHALLTTVLYLQWHECTFPTLAITSLMLAQSTVRVMRNPVPLGFWLWGQCAFSCFMAARCWADLVTGAYALDPHVAAGIWTALILHYAVTTTSTSLITRRFKRLIALL